MQHYARNVVVRPWHNVRDDEGVWTVLKDGSYSNIQSTFIVTLKKPLLWVINAVLLCVGLALGLSPICWAGCLLAEFCVLYIVSAIGAFIYLHGHALSDTNDIHKSYFSNPDHHFWVAECEGQIVGTIAVSRKTSLLEGAPCDSISRADGDLNRTKVAWLRRMAVKRQFRGKGIAKKLVRASLEFCRNRDYDSVFLITTEVHLAAQSLYSNMGFEMLACKPYRYLKGLVTIETFEFEMRLK